MKIELVRFKNGKYGVRRKHWSFGYEFLDLKSSGLFWWTKSSAYFYGCQNTKDIAQNRFDALTDDGEVVE